MKVAFIQDNGINESLALTDLSALLKAHNHICELFIERSEKNFINVISSFNPDLFIIPIDILGENAAFNIIKKIKKVFNKLIVVCGTYPFFFEDIIQKEEIDIIAQGEIEFAILELLTNLEQKKEIKNIKNLYVKEDNKIYKNEVRPLIEDINQLPLPDRALYYKYPYLRNFSMKKFTTGRGCPHHCSFCFNVAFKEKYKNKGPYIRLKKVDRVLEEIENLHRNYLLHSIHFSDDLFTYDKNWVIEFCNKYKANFKLPFTINTTPTEIDEDIVMALKEANCSGIALGVETGNEELRLKVLDKPYTTSDVITAAQLIKKYNIYLSTFNIIALPTETLDNAFETIRLNREIKADNIRINIAFPIPKTKMTEVALKENYLDKDYQNKANFYDLSTPIFKVEAKKEFRNLYYLFDIAAKNELLEKIVKVLIKLPLSFLFKPLTIFRFLREKRFFNIKLISGIIFYLNTGNPYLRTKNFNNYLP